MSASLIDALERERLLVLSCGRPIRSKLYVSPFGTIEIFSQLSTHQPPNVLLTEA